jgi:hypothetical protein
MSENFSGPPNKSTCLNDKAHSATLEKTDDFPIKNSIEDGDIEQALHTDAEDNLLSNSTSTTTLQITKSELDEFINAAVQEALGGMVQLLNRLSGTATTTSAARYSNPTFSFPKYEKEDKLVRAKNYAVWKQRFSSIFKQTA